MAAVAHNQSGFTLIEMLVVTVLIAVLSGVTLWSLNGDNTRHTREEAGRLAQALQMAADEAIYQGTEMGGYFTAHSYGFARYDTKTHHWQALNDKALEAYSLPEDIHLNILFAGKAAPLPQEETASMQHPALIFLSSGEMTAFTLSLSDSKNNATATIGTDGVQPIRLMP